ncbi:MAG: DUF4375 domain-containing protein [Saprospiraceae bacterium]|jgi:hypothetical protein|nr:DUF4375 domain-containing protein [Saprospiraceae bacterium]
MVIITFIIKYGQSEKSLNEKIRKYDLLVSNNKAKKEYTPFSLNELENKNDNVLVFDISMNLFNKFLVNGNLKLDKVLSANKSQQAVFLINNLDGEVHNGGFNQYYTNSRMQFMDLLPNLLNHIGAQRMSELVHKANKTLEENYKEIFKYQDGTVEGFCKSYEDNPLNELDTEFYKLYEKENLLELLTKFVRQNLTDFTASNDLQRNVFLKNQYHQQIISLGGLVIYFGQYHFYVF